MIYSFIKKIVLFIHYFFFMLSFQKWKINEKNVDRLAFDQYVKKRITRQNDYKKKLPTVSAIYRVKNGAEYIEASILSIATFVTQIIIVDNNSSDDTRRIAERLSHDLKDICQIKIYTYTKNVAIAGEGYIQNLDGDDNSLASFYNYSFSLGDCDYLMKVDAHYIFSSYGIDVLQKQLAKKYDGIVYRGIEFYGKWMSNEMFLYKRSLGLKYEDGDFYECLIWDRKKLRIKTLIKPIYLHMKRISFVKYINDESPIFSKYRNKNEEK
ncbi:MULTISPECIES: glycosyltransferase family 2 protein [Citrobacter]|uniref:glycosyltransferase family 2 protein n=1 Tax=Citrobacter TaxID=544 RepID=UPI00079232B5|nr:MULTISPECIES: glycosyltransferase [Citrobacter]SAC93557.1 Glycosyl transferase family 2 [Enterobacter cloacae]KAA0568388.1 glycosyltransferase [Citrobacter portucalensis]MDM2796623.1 glycosyltransferase [Citrobacter sp. Cpo131]MDM2891296.1 glycosyltransferase [Citrobacter sp. Cpo060]MDW2648568.1 glycosyltransferase [Citrobacter portucalensis]